jgi:hypothetical protein
VGEAADAEDFIMTPTGIECDLAEQIRRFVEGEVGDVGIGVDGVVDGDRDIDEAAG